MGRWIPAGGYAPGPLRAHLPWEPPSDVYVSGQTVIIRMELAGVPPDAIELTGEGRLLRVTGERPRPCGDTPCEFRQVEISYGPFQRVFEFPEELEHAEIRARCADGFLTVEVRPTHPGPRRIEIGRPG